MTEWIRIERNTGKGMKTYRGPKDQFYSLANKGRFGNKVFIIAIKTVFAYGQIILRERNVLMMGQYIMKDLFWHNAKSKYT